MLTHHTSPDWRFLWVREPAKSPKAAQQRYVRFLQPALSCLSKTAEWSPAQGEGEDRALLINEHPVKLQRKRGLARLAFAAYQRSEIVEDERYIGEWKTRTLSYAYTVFIDSRRLPKPQEILAWHWHPLRTPTRDQPHMHARLEHRLIGLKLSNLHVPTGRISFEEVVRFLLGELRVVPQEAKWQSILGETEQRFREFRSWA
jgi:hypothetical protein